MLRMIAVGLLCLFLALPAGASENADQAGWWSQIWEAFVEVLGLGDHEPPGEPSADAGEISSPSPPADELGPIIIPHG